MWYIFKVCNFMNFDVYTYPIIQSSEYIHHPQVSSCLFGIFSSHSSLPPTRKQPLIYFMSLQNSFAFSKNLCKQNQEVFCFFWSDLFYSVSLSRHLSMLFCVPTVHSFFIAECILLYGCSVPYLLICWWAFGLCLVLSYY